MKNKLLKSALLFSLLIFLVISNSTCKKGINEQNHNCPQGQHWDNAQQKCVDDSIIPVDTTSNLLSDTTILVDSLNVISSTETSVTINTTTFSKQPTIGCILIAPPCVNAQYGFMRKVTSISGSKSNLQCETEYCGLNEAFKQLHFDDDNIISSSTIDSAVKSKLGIVSSSNVSNSIISSTFKITNLSVADGLTINGAIKVNITAIRKKYDKGGNFILPQDALLEVDMDTEGSSIEVTNSKNLQVKVDKKLLIRKELGITEIPIPAPIVVPPYVIVIPITFQQRLSIYTMPFTIGGKMKLQIAPVFHATIGAHYINGQWNNTSTASLDPYNFTQFCKKDFFVSAGFNSNLTLVNAAFELLPFGSDFLKFSLETPINFNFTTQTNTPNYSLKGQFQVNGNMEAKIWTSNEQKISIGTTLYEKKFAEGNWSLCDTLSLITGSITSITQTSAISGGDIVSDGGDSIISRGVCWSTSHNPTIANSKTNDGTGNGSFISNITGLDSNTTYYVRAYATNSAGTAYGNEVSFTTVAGVLWSGSGWRHYDISCSGGCGDSSVNWPLIVSFNISDSTITGTTDLGDGYKIPTSGTISATSISFECSYKSYNTHGELNTLTDYKFNGTSSGNNIYEGIWSEEVTDYINPNNYYWSGHFYLSKN